MEVLRVLLFVLLAFAIQCFFRDDALCWLQLSCIGTATARKLVCNSESLSGDLTTCHIKAERMEEFLITGTRRNQVREYAEMKVVTIC